MAASSETILSWVVYELLLQRRRKIRKTREQQLMEQGILCWDTAYTFTQRGNTRDACVQYYNSVSNLLRAALEFEFVNTRDPEIRRSSLTELADMANCTVGCADASVLRTLQRVAELVFADGTAPSVRYQIMSSIDKEFLAACNSAVGNICSQVRTKIGADREVEVAVE